MTIRQLAATAATIALSLGTLTADAATTPALPESGHRGATGVAGVPEHSLESLRYVKRNGGIAAEGDVRWTRDGRRVMSHDNTLDRTTACTGSVESKTFAQLRECAPHTQVPQFKYWLKEAKRLGLQVNPELKTIPTAAQANQFEADVKTYGPAFVVVSSSIPEALTAIKNSGIGSRVKYSPIIYPTNSRFGYDVAAHRRVGTVVMPHHASLTADKVADYHRAGVRVWGWPAKTDADIARLQAIRVDVIVKDDVAR